MATIKLKIITPSGIFVNDKPVDLINLKTIDGDLGILPNMAPFITALKISDMNFVINNEKTYIHLHRGLVTIDRDQCKIVIERLYLVDENGTKIDTPNKLD